MEAVPSSLGAKGSPVKNEIYHSKHKHYIYLFFNQPSRDPPAAEYQSKQVCRTVLASANPAIENQGRQRALHPGQRTALVYNGSRSFVASRDHEVE
jgi:hypothetical protein